MRSRYRVKLGGVQMDSLDSDLLILDVKCSEPNFQIKTDRMGNGDGYDYNGEYFEKTTVVVTFELHIYDTKARNKALQAVNEWAKAGGTLTISDREDQQLMNVRCEKFASMDSVRDWTAPLTIVFATTYNPYWRSSAQKTLSLTGTNTSGTLKMDGNVGEALVSVEATANATIKSFKITIGSYVLELKDFSLASDKKLVIDYIRDRYLRVRADGKSIINKLVPSSSDVLKIPCGASTKVSCVASGKMSIIVKARGLWL